MGMDIESLQLYVGERIHVTLSLLCGDQKRQNPPCELLGNHRRQSQQSWLELGMRRSSDSRGANNFVAAAHRSDGKRFVARADEKLTAFVDLEAAIRYKYQNELFRPGRGIAKP